MTRRAAPDDDDVADVAAKPQSAPRRAIPSPADEPNPPRRAARAAEPEDIDPVAPDWEPRHLLAGSTEDSDAAPTDPVVLLAATPTASEPPDHGGTVTWVDPTTVEASPQPLPTEEQGRRRPRWGIPVILLAVAVLIAGVVYGLGADDRQRARTAADTVSRYLTALAQGDASTAAGLLVTEGLDVSLLTDEVLAASAADAPLSELVVGKAELAQDGSTAEVPVSYHLGTNRVETSLEVVLDDNSGRVRGTGTIDLSGVAALDPRVNGVSASSTHPAVFPGSYEVTVANPYIQSGSPAQLITDANAVVTTVDLNLVAIQAGIEMFRQKVGDAVQACLSSTALDPGCGAALPTTLSGGETIVDGTVGRSLSSEDLAALNEIVPEPDPSRPTVLAVSSAKLGTLILEADVRTGDRTVRATLEGYGQGFEFARATIDVSDQALPIVWG